jgi:hypothetical protein
VKESGCELFENYDETFSLVTEDYNEGVRQKSRRVCQDASMGTCVCKQAS